MTDQQMDLEKLLRVYYYMCKTGDKRIEFSELKTKVLAYMGVEG